MLSPLATQVLQFLSMRGDQSAKDIALAAGVSQPTISRALAELGRRVVKTGAARSTRYSLRNETYAALEAPIYRVTHEGLIHEIGTLVPVRPEGFVMLRREGAATFHGGLPWWMNDMRPQGYLGRAFANQHGAGLGLPEKINQWNDIHVLTALLSKGWEAPGNILIGETALNEFMQSSHVTVTNKPTGYAALAAGASRGDVAGSSAGGEQPKFTAFAPCERVPAHVIVKFSALPLNEISQRWQDILLAEHLALEVLAAGGVPSSDSAIFDHDDQRFLEVRRFDRVCSHGRFALFSLESLTAEFAGDTDWPKAVRILLAEKVIVKDAAYSSELLWAFGTLIANTDMHPGNLSFMSKGGRPFKMAPAYDMSPMAFAPTSAGVMPNEIKRPFTLRADIDPSIWHRALNLAISYVERLRAEDRFHESFKPCIEALAAHVGGAKLMIERLA